MKILFITPSVPNDLNRVRAKNIITALSKQGHEVHLVTLFTNKKEIADLERIKPLLASSVLVRNSKLIALLRSACAFFLPLPLEVGYCFNTKMYFRLRRLARKENFDLIYLKRTRMSPYAKLFKNNNIFLDFTDLMSENYHRLSLEERGLKRIVAVEESIKYKFYEKYLAKKKYKIIVCSKKEKENLLSLYKDSNVVVLENGVNLENWDSTKAVVGLKDKKEVTLSFFGVMTYEPNRLAVEIFLKNYLTKLSSNYRFKVFGPGGLNVGLGSERVEYLGFVENIANEIAKTDVFVCPLTTGTGVKNKIIQAASIGMPVLTTKYGSEGIPQDLSKYLFEYKSLSEFKRQIRRIEEMDPSELKKNLRSQAEAFKSYYDINRLVGKFIEEAVITNHILFISNEYSVKSSTPRLNNIFRALTEIKGIETILIGGSVSRKPIVRRNKKALIPNLLKKYIFIFFVFPDENLLFIPQAIRKSLGEVRSKRISLIVTTYPSVSSILAGHVVSKLTGVKHLVDLREPWTEVADWTMRYSNSWLIDARIRFENFIEKKIMENASRVIVNHKGMLKFYKERYGNKQKYVVIPNGFPDYYSSLEYKANKNKSYSIIYAGSYYLKHQPDDVIKILEKLGSGNSDKRRLFRFTVWGNYDAKTESLAKDSRVTSSIRLKGYVDQEKVVKKILESDLAIVSLPDDNWSKHRIPAKFYELLALKAPFIVIGPRGSDLEALAKSNKVPFFACNEVEKASKFVQGLIENKVNFRVEDISKEYGYSALIKKIKKVAVEEISSNISK